MQPWSLSTSETFSPSQTEISYLLNSNSTIPPLLSSWQPLFTFYEFKLLWIFYESLWSWVTTSFKSYSNAREGLSWWLSGTESTCQCRRGVFDPQSGKSSGEGNGNPLQNSCQGNPMDRGAWWATVHGVAKESDMTLWLKQILMQERGLGDTR